MLNCLVPHDIFNAGPLAEKGVDNWCPVWYEWSLAEEAEQRQDTVEGLEGCVLLCAECDSLTQLCKDDQVQDNGAGQQRVLKSF